MLLFYFKKFGSNCTICSRSDSWKSREFIEKVSSTITDLDGLFAMAIFNSWAFTIIACMTKANFSIDNFSQRLRMGIAFADMATYPSSTMLPWNNLFRNLSSSRFFKSIPIWSLPIRIGGTSASKKVITIISNSI